MELLHLCQDNIDRNSLACLHNPVCHLNSLAACPHNPVCHLNMVCLHHHMACPQHRACIQMQECPLILVSSGIHMLVKVDSLKVQIAEEH